MFKIHIPLSKEESRGFSVRILSQDCIDSGDGECMALTFLEIIILRHSKTVRILFYTFQMKKSSNFISSIFSYI